LFVSKIKKAVPQTDTGCLVEIYLGARDNNLKGTRQNNLVTSEDEVFDKKGYLFFEARNWEKRLFNKNT